MTRIDPQEGGQGPRWYTTAEAAEYLRYSTPAGIRSAIARGDLSPDGKGPYGCHLFRVDTLDAFAVRRLHGEGTWSNEARPGPVAGPREVDLPKNGAQTGGRAHRRGIDLGRGDVAAGPAPRRARAGATVGAETYPAEGLYKRLVRQKRAAMATLNAEQKRAAR